MVVRKESGVKRKLEKEIILDFTKVHIESCKILNIEDQKDHNDKKELCCETLKR